MTNDDTVPGRVTPPQPGGPPPGYGTPVRPSMSGFAGLRPAGLRPSGLHPAEAGLARDLHRRAGRRHHVRRNRRSGCARPRSSSRPVPTPTGPRSGGCCPGWHGRPSTSRSWWSRRTGSGSSARRAPWCRSTPTCSAPAAPGPHRPTGHSTLITPDRRTLARLHLAHDRTSARTPRRVRGRPEWRPCLDSLIGQAYCLGCEGSRCCAGRCARDSGDRTDAPTTA